MYNVYDYVLDCVDSAESMNKNFSRYMSRYSNFRYRYLCYLSWGMRLSDYFVKEFRLARFYSQVVKLSLDYEQLREQYGWMKQDVCWLFKAISLRARLNGMKCKITCKINGYRVYINYNGVAFGWVGSTSDVLNIAYRLADEIAYNNTQDDDLADFVKHFLWRESRYMIMRQSVA